MVVDVISARRADRGFSTQVAGNEARRQLRMSVGVVVMLAIGIVSAAATVGSHPMAAKREIVSMAPVATLHADSDLVGAKAI